MTVVRPATFNFQIQRTDTLVQEVALGVSILYELVSQVRSTLSLVT